MNVVKKEDIPYALTVKQVTEYFQISRYTLKILEGKGKIKHHKPNGRDYLFLRDDVIQAIKTC